MSRLQREEGSRDASAIFEVLRMTPELEDDHHGKPHDPKDHARRRNGRE